jgi:RNA polymerase sigma-70 factor (sigma-E family)
MWVGLSGAVSDTAPLADRFLGAPVADSSGEAMAGAVADAVADVTANGASAVHEITGIDGAAGLGGETSLGREMEISLDGETGLDGVPSPAPPVDDQLAAGEQAARPGAGHRAAPRHAAAAWDASEAVTKIYVAHYSQLVRLALLLVHDLQTAEEVVQDAFEAMHKAWRRLREEEKALSYLRQTVVNRSRSVLRHRKVVDLHPPRPERDEPSAEHAALVLIERSAIATALRRLPQRQREAIVLRYYADLSEAEIARAMGISRGAVKSHTARAMASLKTVIGRDTT